MWRNQNSHPHRPVHSHTPPEERSPWSVFCFQEVKDDIRRWRTALGYCGRFPICLSSASWELDPSGGVAVGYSVLRAEAAVPAPWRSRGTVKTHKTM